VNQIITRELKNKAAVSDKEAREYYETNKKKYMRPEARKIRHILISVKRFSGYSRGHNF